MGIFPKRTVIVLWVILSGIPLKGKEGSKEHDPFIRKNNSVSVELFGPTNFYSIQYERFFLLNFIINAGATFQYITTPAEDIPIIIFGPLIAAQVSLLYSIPLDRWGLDVGGGMVINYFDQKPIARLEKIFLQSGVRYYLEKNFLLKIYWNPQLYVYKRESMEIRKSLYWYGFGISFGRSF